ncbi:MAG: nucleotide sugar dehydrogenase [Bryobacteraceae bacterium]
MSSSNPVLQPQTIAMLGLGYVGCVSAACMAQQGHRVIGVDRDEGKVGHIREKKAPFYEPGLAPIVEETVAAGRLTATTSLEEAIAAADVAMVCVGTPSDKNGNLSLEQLHRVAEQIAALLEKRSTPLTVAIRSTVWPGTCEDLYERFFHRSPMVRVVSNPEFLREGSAVKDFLEPSLLVVGGTDEAAVNQVADLYAGLPVEACKVALRTSETIKYACNAFHALKVAFANEIGSLCERIHVPPQEVMATLCEDHKLNVSAAYLKPGFAFGGSCLPKDLRALVYRGSRLDLNLPLLASVLPSNDAHLKRAFDKIVELPAGPLAFYGLAFKENTDDVRESPVVHLLEQLTGKGYAVQVYDPHIRLDTIYGANERFLLATLPHIGKLMVPSLDTLLDGATSIVVAQKPSAADLARLKSTGKPLVDLTLL